MGLADVIPGVSGGTMALILGIYDRLIAAFSILGPTLLRDLLRMDLWRKLIQALKPSGNPGQDRLGETAQHLAFLLNVVLGIGVAVLVGLKFLPQLLQSYPTQMRGFFLGLVLASVVVPYGRIHKRTFATFVIIIASSVGSWFLMGIQSTSNQGFAETTVTLQRTDGQAFSKAETIPGPWLQFHRNTEAKLRHNIAFSPLETVTIEKGQSKVSGIRVAALQAGSHANLPQTSEEALDTVISSIDPKGLAVIDDWTVVQEADASGGKEPALWYIFLCGAIAISAMLLPGVSGAFLLLTLGLYGYIVHQGHAFVYGGNSGALVPLGVFMAGMLVGLGVFSRFLKWLLARYEDVTMAVLIGLMFGSLRVLWPFRDRYTSQNILPHEFDTVAWVAIGAVLAGIVLVALLTVAGNRAQPSDDARQTTRS